MALATDQDYIGLFMDRLGRRTNTDLRARLVDELNVARMFLEKASFLPWFLYTNTELTLVVNQDYLNLPSDFLREVEGEDLLIIDRTETPEVYSRLRKRRLETLQQLHGSDRSDTGKPINYSIGEGAKILLYPTPDEALSLYLPYLRSSAEILDSSSQLNLWLEHCPNYIGGMACVAVAQFHLQNAPLAQKFGELASVARKELIAANEARQHTNMEYSDSDALVDEEQ